LKDFPGGYVTGSSPEKEGREGKVRDKFRRIMRLEGEDGMGWRKIKEGIWWGGFPQTDPLNPPLARGGLREWVAERRYKTVQ